MRRDGTGGNLRDFLDGRLLLRLQLPLEYGDSAVQGTERPRTAEGSTAISIGLEPVGGR
jgi:hypothetical protein